MRFVCLRTGLFFAGLIFTGPAFSQNSVTRVQTEALKAQDQDLLLGLRSQALGSNQYQIQLPINGFRLEVGIRVRVHWPVFQKSVQYTTIQKVERNGLLVYAVPPFHVSPNDLPRFQVQIPAAQLRSVPLTALFSPVGDEQSLLWVDHQSKVQRAKVFLVRILNDRAIVFADLAVGQPIITQGIHRIRIGQQVQHVQNISTQELQ